MAELVKTEHRDALALIRLSRVPSNVLTPALRRELSQKLRAAQNNPDIRAIVLTGAGQGFCPGVDLSEYGGALADPWVDVLCTQIELSSKPVVAALHGAVMGAGFELALAAHARVAHAQARIAMPDIKLSMIPGGGATQRLPRILGAQTALELLLSGQTLYASDPRLARLLSQVTEEAPLEAGIHVAQRLSENGNWRRTRDDDRGLRDPEGYQKALSSVRQQVTAKTSAAADILHCVEAAQLLPFEQGLQFEQCLFRERISAPEARAARHILMAERYAALPPKPAAVVAPVHRVVLYGSRDSLGALALDLIGHGFQVATVTAGPSDAAAFDAWVARMLQSLVKEGKLSEEERFRRMALLDTRSGPKALALADLVLDDGTLPASPLAELQPHAIWALLGRGLRPDARATQLSLPKPILPLHLWPPNPARALAELTLTGQRDMADIAGLMAVLARLGRTTLLTRAQTGEIEHRLRSALYKAGLGLLALGARPEAVDAGAVQLGFKRGPCQMMDRHGLPQVQARVSRSTNGEAADKILEAFIAAGRIGQSAGQGFFAYRDGKASADTATDRLLPERSALGLTEAQLGRAILGAVANAAAQIMTAGLLRRASDIDLAMVKGLGFDRARGGPLLQADLGGLFSLYKEMRNLGKRAPFWVPHARIEEMVKNGEGFFGRSTG